MPRAPWRAWALVCPLLWLAPCAWASSVEIRSTQAIMEPSSGKPGDKDGCPPTSGSADPEEGLLQVALVVTAPVLAPNLLIEDQNDPTGPWTRDTVDDLTLDEFSPINGAPTAGGVRDLDELDGARDGVLAVGTYFAYFNLDKTGYDQDLWLGCAGRSVVGDHEGYTATLRSGTTPVASGSRIVALEKTASIGQSDLEWQETHPRSATADVGRPFCVRSKYRQSSARSMSALIAQAYYHADNVRLDSVELFYYDTDGADPGSVEAGVPGVDAPGVAPSAVFEDVVAFDASTLPATASSGDAWVSRYCFTVTGIGGSGFSPYFMTKNAETTGAWKTDSGYGQMSVPVNPPALSLAKTCDAETHAIEGVPTALSEAVVVCNDGLGEAVDVEVVDTLPLDAQVAFVSAEAGGTFDADARTITWALDVLPMGTCVDLGFTLEVTGASAGGQVATNVGASATAVAPRDLTLVIDADVVEGCPLTLDAAVPLAWVDKQATGWLDLDGDGLLSPGDAVTWRIDYGNDGNVALPDATLDDDLDPLVALADDISDGGGWDGEVLSWSLGTLLPGDGGSVTYTTTLAGPGAFAHGSTRVPNTARLSSPDLVSVRDTEAVDVVAAAELVVAKRVTGTTDLDGDGRLSPGDEVSYEITWENVGNARATEVVVSDDPDEVFIATVTGPYDGDTLSWPVGVALPGAGGSYACTAVLAGPGAFPAGTTPVRNVAVAVAAESRPAPAEVTVLVSADGALALTKEVLDTTDTDGDGLVSPGDGVTWRLSWENTGNAALTGAVLVDDPDEGWVAGVSSGGAYDGDLVRWDLGELAPGATGAELVEAVLTGAFPEGTTEVANVAVLSAIGADPVNARAAVLVEAAPALVVDKVITGTTARTSRIDNTASAGAASGSAGADVVTATDVAFRIEVRNMGNAPATAAVLSDALPPGTTLVSASPTPTWEGATARWDLGDLAPGALTSVTLTVRAD